MGAELAILEQGNCRTCRRYIQHVAGIGWLHTELPQYAHEPITCDYPHPLECGHLTTRNCPLDPAPAGQEGGN